MNQLDRIEQKLDHLLRLVESLESKLLENDAGRILDDTPDGTKFKLPPRELRKWPEINHRPPRTPTCPK